MERLAFDTNIVIRFFKNDPVITNRLASSPTVYLPVPVIAKLLFAARNSSRTEENLKIYNEFIATCNYLSITVVHHLWCFEAVGLTLTQSSVTGILMSEE